jgi:hypothetical protein
MSSSRVATALKRKAAHQLRITEDTQLLGKDAFDEHCRRALLCYNLCCGSFCLQLKSTANGTLTPSCQFCARCAFCGDPMDGGLHGALPGTGGG